jgi:hypothetical protein
VSQPAARARPAPSDGTDRTASIMARTTSNADDLRLREKPGLRENLRAGIMTLLRGWQR